jgi:hypothetical protein
MTAQRMCPTCGHYSPADKPLACCPIRSVEAVQLQSLDAQLRSAAFTSGFNDTANLLAEAAAKVREAIRILDARAGG